MDVKRHTHRSIQSRVTRFFLDPIHSFKNRCYAWLFLLKGPGIIQDGYNKVTQESCTRWEIIF